MYGFAYGTPDTYHVLVRPFYEEELVKVYGSEEQMEDIRWSLRQRDMELGTDPIVIFFDEEEMELMEEGIFYESLAG